VADPNVVDVRIGRRMANGSVRYVVRPVEWLWVGIMAAVGLGIGVVAVTSGATWYSLLIFLILPLCVAWSSGFDIDPNQRTIRGWHAFGFIPFGGFTLTSVDMPEVRTAVETNTNSEGVESSGKVTRLYWSGRNLRTTLPREALRELLEEAKQVARSS
jgi:hypothetical protein